MPGRGAALMVRPKRLAGQGRAGTCTALQRRRRSARRTAGTPRAKRRSWIGEETARAAREVREVLLRSSSRAKQGLRVELSPGRIPSRRGPPRAVRSEENFAALPPIQFGEVLIGWCERPAVFAARATLASL